MPVPSLLIDALKSKKIDAVRAAIKADPASARQARPMVQAGSSAFQAALELLQRNGGDVNASWRNYRPLHALLQGEPHAGTCGATPERLGCLEWLLSHGADPELLGAWPS